MKTVLSPRFIGPFTVVVKMGFDHTLNLPHKLRTQPVFYAVLLKPYQGHFLVDLEAFALGRRTFPRIDESLSSVLPSHQTRYTPISEGIG